MKHSSRMPTYVHLECATCYSLLANGQTHTGLTHIDLHLQVTVWHVKVKWSMLKGLCKNPLLWWMEVIHREHLVLEKQGMTWERAQWKMITCFNLVTLLWLYGWRIHGVRLKGSGTNVSKADPEGEEKIVVIQERADQLQRGPHTCFRGLTSSKDGKA